MGLQANGGSQGEHYRFGRLADAPQEQRHLPAGLPDTLRSGRGQGARDPGCASDSCRAHREPPPMLELLFRSCFRWRLHPRSVTADAAYGTTENIAAIEKAGIRAYMALVDHEKRASLFGRDAFTYDAEKDLYTCPKGELLVRRGYDDYRERSVRYAARPSVCNVRARSKPDAPRAQRGAG
jgi:hypothetical protein